MASSRILSATLVDGFRATARRDETTGVTIVSDTGAETFRSYSQLWAQARGLAGALSRAGVEAGDRVMLTLPTSFELCAGFFAAQMLGAVPVPAYPPAMMERREAALERLTHIARHSGATACVCEADVAGTLAPLVSRAPAMRRVLITEQLERDASPLAEREVAGSEIAFIQYTSGSTGRPKGVVLTHDNLMANIEGARRAAHIGAGDVMVSWLPLYHDMGLIGALLTSVCGGLPLVLLSPTTFMMKPRLWLEAISRHRGTLSCAPNFAYAVCVKRVGPEQRAGLDLSSWRIALNGAEPVNAATAQAFAAAFAPCGFDPCAMYPAYGLAESCVAVTFPEPGSPLVVDVVERDALAAGRAVPGTGAGCVSLVAVGRAIPGHEVRIADAAGESLPERAVGNIVVRGPSVMRGYYGDDRATGDALRDGWLQTGDLGYLAGGQLFIAGRVKDMIIVKGKNYYAEDVERVAEDVLGVRPGSAVAFAVYDHAAGCERAVVLCETRLTGAAQGRLAEAVRTTITAGCGLAATVEVFDLRALPRTSSGKRQRALSRELYAAGKLRPLKGTVARALHAMRLRAWVLRERARYSLTARSRNAA